MFTESSLNVPWKFPESSLSVPWMFPECSLNVPECSLMKCHRWCVREPRPPPSAPPPPTPSAPPRPRTCGHSGNIQCDLSLLRPQLRVPPHGLVPVAIQGTFSVTWADAREPPSQLQEALKKNTKVDEEYNLQTWVPKTRVNKTKRRIPEVELRVYSHSASIIIIREHSGNIQGTFSEHSVNIQWTFSEHLGNIQGTFSEHSVNIQWTFRECWVKMQWTFSEHSGNIQRIYGEPIKETSSPSSCTGEDRPIRRPTENNENI
jgi:hypothetical protein